MPPASSMYREPVTCRLAPRKCNFMWMASCTCDARPSQITSAIKRRWQGDLRVDPFHLFASHLQAAAQSFRLPVLSDNSLAFVPGDFHEFVVQTKNQKRRRPLPNERGFALAASDLQY